MHLDRIPARFILDVQMCADIALDSIRCPICDGAIKTSLHLFIDRVITRNLWLMVKKWWIFWTTKQHG